MKKEKNTATLELLKRVFVKDKTGKTIFDSGIKSSHSFVIQFLEAFYAMCSATDYSATEIDGSESNWTGGGAISLNGVANNEFEGIVVGTGAGAEANDDNAMGTLIADGIAATQLQYGSQAFTAPTLVGGNVDLVLDRTFTNGSGGSITVTEIGVHMQPSSSSATTTCRLMIRDLLSSGVAVADGATLTVQYTLRTTV